MPTLDYQFGAGTLVGKPVAGNLAANPTPMTFGTLQSVDLEISYEVKELYGQNQFPVAIARAKGKITGKAKFAQINGKILNDMFFSQTVNTGQSIMVVGESHAVPATPFQVTIAPPGSGTFAEDLGVSNSATGLPLTRVASSPVTLQYSVNEGTGVYTFAAADTGNTYLISYKFSETTTGVNFNVTNQAMGYAPIFEVHLFQNFQSNPDLVKLNNCVATKLTRSTKLDDFVVPEFDFSAFADVSGNLGQFNLAQ